MEHVGRTFASNPRCCSELAVASMADERQAGGKLRQGRRHYEPQLGGYPGTTEVAAAKRYLIVRPDRGLLYHQKKRTAWQVDEQPLYAGHTHACYYSYTKYEALCTQWPHESRSRST